MSRSRLQLKLNNKMALLAAPCLLALIVLYALGAGFGGGADSAFSGPATPTTSIAGDAETGSTGRAEPAGSAGLGFETAMDVVLKLIVVVGLIFATAKALQYFGGRARGQVGSRALIRVVESRSLAQNQVLHLVEVGDRMLLVGATGSQLTALTEITDRESLGSLRAKIEDNCSPQESFAQHLQMLTSRLQIKVPAPAGETLQADRIREITALIRGVTAEARQATSWRNDLGPTRPSITAEDQSFALQ